MEITQDNLKEMLVSPGHITQKDFELAISNAVSKKITVQQELIESGLISDENLGRTVADFFDYHFVDLHEVALKDEQLTYIPQVVARAQRAVVFGATDTQLQIATENIDNYEFFRLVEKKTGKEVSLYYATAQGLDKALKFYKGDLHNKINTLIDGSIQDQEDGDIVRLVDLFLEYANDNRASDIHIEPLENEVLIRFRVDGLLHEAVRYPKPLHEKIIFRIKIMSHLQTDEHAAAQDGRFEYRGQDSIFDVRVSILPITDGENVVMRLLDSRTHRYSLENLGLGKNDYAKIIGAIEKPHGMILAVGPTGSGKTTVLYTILEKLNSSEVNIMTVEDPVEYDIEGVQQTQVNPKKNLTFATGLRSIVRQDPDIIMVGEIRDEETADISINSALTGHLVISTLHTNDAATTFPRLMEMNVEPFLIASSVNLVVALRLVRKICDHCKESYIPTAAELELLQLGETVTSFMQEISGNENIKKLRLYRGAGCKVCRNSGYSGRGGIFEILEVNEEIRLLITKKSSAEVINDKAVEQGMTSLLYDGITKALNGMTTLEEVMKVART
jgi:type II secretory ATPase GspE/PulE/Tfp pilus assembly ATPase PilB-like protein